MRWVLVVALLGCGSSPGGKADAPAVAGWHTVSTNFDQPLTGLWVSGADVFIVGYQATSYHSSDGQTFAAVPLNAGTTHGTRAWGTSPTDVYATGFSGKMVHSSDRAASWQPVTTGATAALYGMWGVPGTIYVVGNDAVFESADGVTWQSQTPPPLGHILGVWGSSASDLYAVGDLGIARSTGNGTWTVQSGAPAALVNVWGTAANNIYSVGPGIYHSDGSGAWVQQTGCAATTIYSLWGSSASDVWAVGSAGTLCHSNGDGN